MRFTTLAYEKQQVPLGGGQQQTESRRLWHRHMLQRQGLGVDASLTWRERGGKPTSDTEDRLPRFWVTAGWRF